MSFIYSARVLLIVTILVFPFSDNVSTIKETLKDIFCPGYNRRQGINYKV